MQGGGVLFLASLHLLNEFGGAPHADDHDACGEGVEGAGMTYLDLLSAQGPGEGAAHLCHELEGGLVQGLVEGHDEWHNASRGRIAVGGVEGRWLGYVGS